MEFLGLFWFVGVFFRIVVRWFYGGLLEGYEFPKSRFSVQAFRFFAVGFEPFRTIECFFPYGFSLFGIPAERRFSRSVETFCFVASSVAVVCPFSIERSFASQILCIGRRKSRISGIRTPKLRSSGLFLPRVSALFYRSILYGN